VGEHCVKHSAIWGRDQLSLNQACQLAGI